MIKQFTLAYKKPGMSDEEFSQHWEKIHGPLFARVAPGLRRYIQNHIVQVPGIQQKGNGFAVTWYDDLESQATNTAWIRSGSATAKEVMEDGRQFMGPGGLGGFIWLVDEREIIKGDKYRIKEIRLVYKKAGVIQKDFDNYWKYASDPLADKKIPYLKRYVKNDLIPVPGMEYDGDGIAEFFFDNLDDLKKFDAFSQTSEGKALLGDKFLDMGKTMVWIAEERVIK